MNEEIINFINYINNKYNSFEMENINNHLNIKRYTKPTMAGFVENGTAALIADILKDKKYSYLIDSQMSVGKGQPIRPDIIIYDEKGIIHGIVEVKSQLGYSGNFNENIYNKKIKELKYASKNGILKIKKENISFTISKNCVDFVVILMNSNGHHNIEKFKNINSFILFTSDKNDLWYDNLSLDFLNKDENGFFNFCTFIKRIGD